MTYRIRLHVCLKCCESMFLYFYFDIIYATSQFAAHVLKLLENKSSTLPCIVKWDLTLLGRNNLIVSSPVLKCMLRVVRSFQMPDHKVSPQNVLGVIKMLPFNQSMPSCLETPPQFLVFLPDEWVLCKNVDAQALIKTVWINGGQLSCLFDGIPVFLASPRHLSPHLSTPTVSLPPHRPQPQHICN